MTRHPVALAACAWSILFVIVSTYWAFGGEIGLDQLALSIQEAVADDDTSFRIQNGLGIVAKCVWALIAWSMYRPVRQRRRLLLVLGWATGVVLTLYGAAGTIEKALMYFDLRPVAASIGENALVWYVLLWDPYWLLGGLLFLAASWTYQRGTK